MSYLEMTLSEVQELVGGGRLHGDPRHRCESVASLAAAGPSDLSFVKDPARAEEAEASAAGALLTAEYLPGSDAHQLVVEDPFHAFVRVLERVARAKRRLKPGIDSKALVSPDAVVAADAAIGPGAVVREDAHVGARVEIHAGAYVGPRCRIGADTVIHPGAVLEEEVTVGKRVVIQAGAVIGADGYGYLQRRGRHIKIPQVGEVVIEDDVEIGAGTTIDRATLDRTVIRKGTKVGDLVHVAHNCEVGEHVLLLPTVAIAGSVTVGNHVVFAGRAGCADNLHIGEGAVLGGTAVAFQDVPAGAELWGNPAQDKRAEIRTQLALRRLPELKRELRQLREAVSVLEAEKEN